MTLSAGWYYPLTGEAWTAELTLDQGEVEAEGRTSALCEIELELQRGVIAGFAAGRAASSSTSAPPLC